MLLLLSSPVMIAYLDPGTGSYLFQLLIAGLLSLGFTLRMFRDRIAAFFRRLFKKEAPAAATTPPSDPNRTA